jgi:hypothetical protein
MAADPLRHGEVLGPNSDDGDGKDLFITTWNIVDGYLKGVPPGVPSGTPPPSIGGWPC